MKGKTRLSCRYQLSLDERYNKIIMQISAVQTDIRRTLDERYKSAVQTDIRRTLDEDYPADIYNPNNNKEHFLGTRSCET